MRAEGKSYITQDEYSRLTEEQRVRIAEFLREQNKEIYDNLDTLIILKKSFYRDYIKRIIDIVISAIALVVTTPINLVLLIGTFFDVGLPVLFHQERVGKDGKVFDFVKFRNMTNERNENGTLLLPEQRVTEWGKIVRRLSFDELLNFWYVIKGDMSLIGPRPLPKKYYSRFTKKYNQRHLIKPGLECPMMIEKKSDNGWQNRFDNDLWYVENVSFINDVKMGLKLIRKVLSNNERNRSAAGRHGEFLGFDKYGDVVDSYHVRYDTAALVKKGIGSDESC